MSKGAKKRNSVKRREEKKRHKLANFVKFGPKSKDGNAKGRHKLKGERRPRKPKIQPQKSTPKGRKRARKLHGRRK